MTEEIRLNKKESILVFKPKICPYCGKGIDAKVISVTIDKCIFLGLKCPVCEEVFFAKYHMPSLLPPFNFDNMTLSYVEVFGGSPKKDFSSAINKLSPDFVKIYNQAFKAEHEKLKDVAGIGYRLAFEHLIKDYCLYLEPEEKDYVLKNDLSRCIDRFIKDNKKDIIKRTCYLGNDFSHYVSKHPDLEINDLKKVIDICVLRIESELIEKDYCKKID